VFAYVGLSQNLKDLTEPLRMSLNRDNSLALSRGSGAMTSSRDLKTAAAEGPFLLTAVEFVPGSPDVTDLV
jgi:hypothetical protein